MCGRMILTRSGDEIADYFIEALARSAAGGIGAPREIDGTPLRRRFNLAPSQDVLTLVPAAAGSGEVATFAWKRWGLVPSWAKDPSIGARMFNARAETVDTKPSFRAAFKRRRCLVAADGFYEWTPRDRGHRPFLFRPTRGTLLAFAGLFEEWQGEGGECIESCTVLTADANADLEGVHHRMPVILAPDQLAEWLDPSASPELLKALAISAPRGSLARTPVSRFVNDPRHQGERCVAPEVAPEVKPEQVDLFAQDAGSHAGGAGRPPTDEEF